MVFESSTFVKKWSINVLICGMVIFVSSAQNSVATKQPYIYADDDGAVYVQSANAEQPIFFNNVNLISEINTLKSQLNEVRTQLGLPTSGNTATSDETVEVLPNGNVFINSKSGSVYTSSFKEHLIEEGFDDWKTTELTVLVGDYIKFQWSSLESIYETDGRSSATARDNGASSGPASIGGTWVYRIVEAREHYFRAANKGYVVVIKPLEPAELPIVGGYQQWSERPSGYNYESLCSNKWGLVTRSTKSDQLCSCDVGRTQTLFSGYVPSSRAGHAYRQASYICIATAPYEAK